jgi:hypothetical protein
VIGAIGGTGDSELLSRTVDLAYPRRTFYEESRRK